MSSHLCPAIVGIFDVWLSPRFPFSLSIRFFPHFLIFVVYIFHFPISKKRRTVHGTFLQRKHDTKTRNWSCLSCQEKIEKWLGMCVNGGVWNYVPSVFLFLFHSRIIFVEQFFCVCDSVYSPFLITVIILIFFFFSFVSLLFFLNATFKRTDRENGNAVPQTEIDWCNWKKKRVYCDKRENNYK